MKKIIVIISALVLSATAANAQDWLKDFLKVATEKVGDVVTGTTAVSSAFDIKGTWQYQGVAVGASSDNVLTSLAASAGTGTIEKKCDELLAKAGIKAGLEGLVGKVPGLLDVKVHTEGRLASSNADVMLDSTLESEEALKGYAQHPDHVAVANTKVRPYTVQRACLDFEIAD